MQGSNNVVKFSVKTKFGREDEASSDRKRNKTWEKRKHKSDRKRKESNAVWA